MSLTRRAVIAASALAVFARNLFGKPAAATIVQELPCEPNADGQFVLTLAHRFLLPDGSPFVLYKAVRMDEPFFLSGLDTIRGTMAGRLIERLTFKVAESVAKKRLGSETDVMRLGAARRAVIEEWKTRIA